jgi:hypothetical protein
MKLPVAAVVSASLLSVVLSGCSASGGSGNVTPRRTPGAIVFTGLNGLTITNNTMTYFCDNTIDFTVSQANYSGTFVLTDNSPAGSESQLSPTSGTSSTQFSYYAPPTSSSNGTWTITATGAPGTTGTLTITGVCDG